MSAVCIWLARMLSANGANSPTPCSFWKLTKAQMGLSPIFYPDFSACLLFVHQTHISLRESMIEAEENVLGNSYEKLIPNINLTRSNSV